ncbi:hypothetical protein GHT09_018206 [Marmota monax]|uniref:Uncharacterized protein n=1 Tax=Marmota monax TaxID=9995 RepID=A0A834PKL6_MARMO|nr:hypothetical protein GHT09_018206 [Marmota monax]
MVLLLAPRPLASWHDKGLGAPCSHVGLIVFVERLCRAQTVLVLTTLHSHCPCPSHSSVPWGWDRVCSSAPGWAGVSLGCYKLLSREPLPTPSGSRAVAEPLAALDSLSPALRVVASWLPILFLFLSVSWLVAQPRALNCRAVWPTAQAGVRQLCRPAHWLFSPLSLSGLGYDPYNPELPKPPAQRENGALGRGDEPRSDILELELVNQAIEAVRSEVELEQRRYQELLETAREYSSTGAAALAPCGPATSPTSALDKDAFPLTFSYTSSSRGLLTPDASYQPTPLATPAEPGSKYSLASLERGQGKVGGGSSALEYVPKAVSQSRRYGRPVPSSKYVVDNSKPSTDLEYDPLSNYSARHLSRASSRDERATKRPRGCRGSEPYTPALKKPCDPFGGCDARFSDSEDDTTPAAAEEPATASSPVAEASPSKAGTSPKSKIPGKPSPKEGLEPEEGSLRETKEMAVQCDVGDLGQPPKGPDGASPAKSGSPARALQGRGGPKEGTPKKKNGTPLSLGHKDSARKKDKTKDKDRGRSEKPGAGKKSLQTGSPRHKAERPEGTKKKPSSATPVASSGKGRPTSGGPRPQDSRPSPQQLPDRKGGGKMPSGKLVERKARSLDEGASQDAPKLKKRALSHAELFGDESEEEGPGPRALQVRPPALPSLSSDSDSDSDSSLGLSAPQLPKRLKASPPPSPASSSSSSSSSSSGAGEDAEEDVDYSALEKEVDFDSDPMEECLRIFNESTSVKTEDKGRLARQVRGTGQLQLGSWSGRPWGSVLALRYSALARALQGDVPPYSCLQTTRTSTTGRSCSFSTGLLTHLKFRNPRWPPAAPPAPSPERGPWLTARPAGFPRQRLD